MDEPIYLMTKGQYEHIKQQLYLIVRRLNLDSFSQESKWMSTEETMDLLNIGRTTLWNYQKDGKIKASRIGRKLHFNREDIEKLLIKNTG